MPLNRQDSPLRYRSHKGDPARGYDSLASTWRMNARMIVMSIVFITLLAYLPFVWFQTELYEIQIPAPSQAVQWSWSWFVAGLPVKGGTVKLMLPGTTAAQVYDAAEARDYLASVIGKEWAQFSPFLVNSLWSYPGCFVALLAWYRYRDRTLSASKHIRGQYRTTAKDLVKRVRQEQEGDIAIGPVILPRRRETEHVFTAGGTGSGKTTFLRSVLGTIRGLGKRAIVHDTKLDLCREFWRPGDIILSPFLHATTRWTIFSELESIPQAFAAAHSVVVDEESTADKFWSDAARQIFFTLLVSLASKGTRRNHDLAEALKLDAEGLTDLLQVTPWGAQVAHHISSVAGPQSAGVLANLHRYSMAFSFMQDGDFSFRSWIRDEHSTQWVWIVNPPSTSKLLAPILTLAIDLACMHLLELPDSDDRRLYLILDELSALNKLSSLLNILQRGRSKGASAWLSVQDLGGLKAYSRDERDTIINNCMTKLLYRTSAVETAKYFEQMLGQQQIEQAHEAHTLSISAERDSIGVQRRDTTESLILASELASLPPYQAFLAITGHPIARLELSNYGGEGQGPGSAIYQMRDDLLLRAHASTASTPAITSQPLKPSLERPFLLGR